MRLTDIAIKTLAPPQQGQKTYTDDTLPGFGVRVSQGGTKTFVLVYGERRERVTLGRYPIITLAQAREKAKDILARRQLNGDDPKPTLTFEGAFEAFIRGHLQTKNRPSTAKETERLIRRHALPVLKTRPIAAVTTRDLSAIIDGILSTPSEANHLHTALKTFLNFCRRRGYLDRNPLEALQKPAKAVSRERVLSDPELALVLTTARSRGLYGALVELLILTGQRAGQLANLRGEWVNREARTITWPGKVMKGGVEHTIPYGDRVALVLEGLPKQGLLFHTETDETVPFNNWSNSHTAFLASCGVEHFTRHDLRRTFSTGLARLGVPPHVTERILAHSSGTISGVAAIYNRHSYQKEMREALRLWESHLVAIMPPPKG